MPKAHGFSPAQLLFGRSQIMLLPQPAAAFSPIDFKQAAVARDQLFHSQAGHYNRDKVDLEQLSPRQSVRVQNESSGLWDLTGEVIDIRPDKLSYLVDIEGRTFLRGRAKLKPVFKVGSHEENEVGVTESESHSNVGVSSLGPETLNSELESAPTLRRSSRLFKKCVPSLSSASSCGLSSDVASQHVPFSYSLPCPVMVPDVRERQRRKSLKSSEKWPNSTETTLVKTPLTSPTLASPYSTFNGPVLPPGPLPWELSRSSAAPSSSAACGRLRLDEGDVKIRSACLRQSAPSVPQPMSPPQSQPPPGLMFLPPPRLPLQAQIGSGHQQDGPVFPHYTMQDRVVFEVSRTPSSRHCYMTGNFCRCGYPSCRQAIEMRTFPAVTYNAGTPYGTLSRFTELRDEEDRRSESSRPPRRRSPAPRRESPPRRESSTSVQSSSAQTTASGYSRRREYQTGVQPPTN